MSLFKPFMGNRANLDAVEKHAGYAYFCIDDGSFHIDYVDSDGNLQRKQINAKDAETLCGMSLEDIQNSFSWNNLLDRPFGEETIEPITWNGVVGDNATFVRDGFTFVKVSDRVLIKDDFTNGATFVFSDGNDTDITDMYVLDEGTGIHIFMYAYSFREACEIDGITISEAGTYFALGSTGLYVQSLSFPSIIRTIDEKYIPDTIARASQVAQSDWSINDETNPAYVKNRTHWVSDEYQKTLFESQDVEFLYNTEYGVSTANITFTDSLKEGAELTIALGGTEYPVVVQSLGMNLVIGNLSIAGAGSDTGEPFVLIDSTDVDWEVYTQDTENTTHRMSIFYVTQDYHKLDKIYLPDDVILPEVSSEEEGYTIAVQDGKWAVNRPVGMSAGIGTGGEIFNSYFGAFTNEAGVYGHAEGETTKALGQASHTAGQGTIASGLGQYVFGTYNIEDTSESDVEWAPERGRRKYVHIVGNGTNNSKRSNAHTLDWSGNAWFAGDVKVGGTGQDDAAAKTLATTDDLSWNSLKDRPFYYSDDATLYEATVTTSDLGGFFGYIGQDDEAKDLPALIEEKTYTVVFDGTLYSCVCSNGSNIGNLSILGSGEDTGEPFMLVFNAGYMIAVVTNDTADTTHSVKVDGPMLKTIDEQYLPELPYVTLQEGNQYWVGKSDFAQTNSNLTYKGQSYSTNHDYFLYFLTAEGIWQISLTTYSYAQTPSMSSFRMNYASSDGTLSFYWKDASNTTTITTSMHAYLHDVNTGNIIRRETDVQSVTIGTYTKKSHNVDFYINKSNPQPAEIVRSFDDYVETYSKDETDALLSVIRPKSTTVTISAANWTGSTNPWSQVVTVSGATENSKIDLCPTALQIVALQDAGVSLMLQNDSGVVTAWAIGNKPTTDYTINVLLTEVSAV